MQNSTDQKTHHSNQWRNDISSGLTASIVTLPKAMAYGSIAFAPLGAEYIPLGIMAGLLSLAFGNLICFRNSNPILINSTFSLASMMLASALVLILNKVSFLPVESQLSVAICMLFLVVFCSGLIQVVAGLTGLGGLSKYIPRPVIAGLTNGVSILIAISQVPIIVTGSSEISWKEFNALIDAWNLGNLIVGALTITAVLYGNRITTKIPSVFIGIFIGCLAFYGIEAVSGQLPGAVLGKMPSGIPLPDYAKQFLALDIELLKQCLGLLPYMLGVSGILSLWSLLFMTTADNMLGIRSNGNHELIGQGMSNMLVSVFGGVSVAGNSNTLINYSNGGRTKLSKFSCAMFALAALVFLGPAISPIPLVVLAGILIVFSIQAIDKWSINHARLLLKRNKEGLPDFLIMLAVMSILLSFGVFEAVAAGIFISLILFIQRMGKEIVRDDHRGDEVGSCVMRNPAERELLISHGRKIRIIEIEGALFFGTVDRVVEHIHSLPPNKVQFIILDMRRITDVDGTGAEALIFLHRHCQRHGQHLLLSGIDTEEADNAFLKSIGILDVFTDQAHFIYLNDALTVAEDSLLEQLLGPGRYENELQFNQLDIVDEFTHLETSELLGYFEKLQFEHGEIIFRQGVAADSIYLLANGRVNIKIFIQAHIHKTVSTFCPGFAFGEMALREGRCRYGTAYAESKVVCYCLTRPQLHQLQFDNSQLAYKLLAGMATVLSDRIAIATQSTTTSLYL